MIDAVDEEVSLLPAVTPVLVTDIEDVDRMIRSARADMARLSLQLRALKHQETVLEGAAPERDAAETSSERPSAREYLRTDLEARFATRRASLPSEIAQAHAAAARRVLGAHNEAAVLVSAARDELLRVLGGLRVPASPQETSGTMAGRSLRSSDGEAVVSSLQPPLLVPDPAEPQVFPGPPVQAVAPPLGDFAAPVPLGFETHSTSTTVPAVASPQQKTRLPPQRSLRAQFLHVDVVLPLVAVAIVLIVLLAWLS